MKIVYGVVTLISVGIYAYFYFKAEKENERPLFFAFMMGVLFEIALGSLLRLH